jgi:hypothetical protein
MTATWTARISWCLIAFGVLLWTPAADLLPVELWLWLAKLGRGSVLPGQEMHFRIVPASLAPIDPVALMGVALIAFGLVGVFAARKMASKRQ